MDYNKKFEDALNVIRAEGRYRVFADLKRKRGDFPNAQHFTPEAVKPITVWCSNDYLGMGQHPGPFSPPCTRRSTPSAPARAAPATSLAPPAITSNSRGRSPTCMARKGRWLFTSAYVANDATLATLTKLIPGLVDLLGAEDHASMIEGIRHGGGPKEIWRHNDVADLEAKLKKYPLGTPKLIAFESVYSMDMTFEHSFGIEEEFFLVDANTGLLGTPALDRLMSDARARLGEWSHPSCCNHRFEIASPILRSHSEACEVMSRLGERE